MLKRTLLDSTATVVRIPLATIPSWSDLHPFAYSIHGGTFGPTSIHNLSQRYADTRPQ